MLTPETLTSDMAASSLDAGPQDSSLFLAGSSPSRAARCLSSSSTRYSAFGMVKLSRTSLGFLGFSALAGLAVCAGFGLGYRLLRG
jgi:hypothetical protein